MARRQSSALRRLRSAWLLPLVITLICGVLVPRLVDGYASLQWTRYHAPRGAAGRRGLEHARQAVRSATRTLDLTADEKVLGKPVANDLREGKVTLPVIFLLRRSGRPGAEAVSAVLADRGFGRVSREELLKLAREHGALDEARALAERYAAAARADLAGFERSPYREALEALPDFILARDH